MPLRKSERSTTLKIKLIANKAITGLTCPNCRESKVAHSRTKSSDSFLMLLLPKRPYRCLLCYQRFWLSEGFFSHRGRTVVWLCLMLGLGGSLFWLVKLKSCLKLLKAFYHLVLFQKADESQFVCFFIY